MILSAFDHTIVVLYNLNLAIFNYNFKQNRKVKNFGHSYETINRLK